MADSKKIGGFDEYEVKNAARILIEAVEIRRKPKFYAVVKKEVKRIADDATQAAKDKQDAATKIRKE